jgi:hypothetical protein
LASWLINLFLFAGTALVPCAIILEIAGFKVMESANLREFNVLDFHGVVVDHIVQVNDLGMGARKGAEKLKDVL